MKKAVVVGLGYHPGHLLHMKAFNEMLINLDYSVYTIYHRGYKTNNLNSSINTYLSKSKVDIVIIYSPSVLNFLTVIYFRFLRKSKVYFYFHEPFDTVDSYRKAGFSNLRIFKLICFDIINRLCVLFSNVILLGSVKSLSVFKRNYSRCNRNSLKMPLIYPAIKEIESTNVNKQYISYIGTVASDHAFENFFNFMIASLKDSDLSNFRFLIATSSTLSQSMLARVRVMDNSNRVKIFHGEYMTDDFINKCYSESSLVWNAYTRGMQSGVLARSFMFSTPVIVYKFNENEYVRDRYNSYFISDLNDFTQFKSAIIFVDENLLFLSKNARETYDKNFNYSNFLGIF